MNTFDLGEMLVKGECAVGVEVTSEAKWTVVYCVLLAHKQQIYIVCNHKTL